MNEHFSTSQYGERTDTGTNSPVVNSDPFADKVPEYDAPLRETPMGENPAVVAPMEEMITPEVPMGEMITHETPLVTNAGSPPTTLLNPEVSEHYHTRWNEIQGRFVDEPRAAVQQADALVSEVIDQITQMFAHEHGSLETQWKQGDDVSTEDLRKALQHYRSFFNRLVV
jgi:hypothetical protein